MTLRLKIVYIFEAASKTISDSDGLSPAAAGKGDQVISLKQGNEPILHHAQIVPVVQQLGERQHLKLTHWKVLATNRPQKTGLSFYMRRLE